jgi:hypothetical protein
VVFIAGGDSVGFAATYIVVVPWEKILKVSLLSSIIFPKVRNSPSFQRRIDHGHFSIELHAWRHAESRTFAMFIHEKIGERFLRHFTGSDETEVIRQALMWCEKN